MDLTCSFKASSNSAASQIASTCDCWVTDIVCSFSTRSEVLSIVASSWLKVLADCIRIWKWKITKVENRELIWNSLKIHLIRFGAPNDLFRYGRYIVDIYLKGDGVRKLLDHCIFKNCIYNEISVSYSRIRWAFALKIRLSDTGILLHIPRYPYPANSWPYLAYLTVTLSARRLLESLNRCLALLDEAEAISGIYREENCKQTNSKYFADLPYPGWEILPRLTIPH